MEGQRFLLLINTQLLKRGINEIEILIFGSGAVWLETGEALNYRTEERSAPRFCSEWPKRLSQTA